MIAASLIADLESRGDCDSMARADAIKHAVKFEVVGSEWMSPDIQDYTRLLLSEGLLRLPYPVCYFEIQHGSALDHVDIRARGSRQSWLAITSDTDEVGVVAYGKLKNARWGDGILAGWSYGNRYPEKGVFGVKHDFDDLVYMSGLFPATIVAFLDVKDVTVKDVEVSNSVNIRRIRQGKLPFYSHKVLRISPEAKATLSAEASKNLTLRRAHWRRGHLRHLPSKVVPVAPALVRGNGFVSKDYRVGA